MNEQKKNLTEPHRRQKELSTRLMTFSFFEYRSKVQRAIRAEVLLSPSLYLLPALCKAAEY